MKLLNKNLLLLAISFIFFASCKDKDATNAPTLGSQEKFTILDYGNLRKLEWKGLFAVANTQLVTQSYENGQDWHRGSTFVGAQAFKDVSQLKPATVNGLTLNVPDMRDGKSPNQIELYENDSRSDGLFGREINISAFGMVGSMYVPKKLKLLAPKPDNVSINSFKGTPVKRGEGINLKWNADGSNKRGVILEIDYYLPQGNGFQKTVRLLDDNGSYSVTSDLLSIVPKDAYFELTLTRGNYHIGDNKEDLIMCLASVKSGYKILD